MATLNLKAAGQDPQGYYSSDNSSNGNNVTKTGKVNVLELFRGRRSDGAAFDMTEDVRFYKPIDSYEGMHRWDPDFEWEEWEERKVVRKVSALHPLNSAITLMVSRSISASAPSHALLSLHLIWTEVILSKRSPILCWKILVLIPTTTTPVKRSFMCVS